MGKGRLADFFYPQKCTTINISKKRHPIKKSYPLHNQTLEDVPSGKYLGITISQDLSWREHSNSSVKATRTIGFLRRNLRSCPQDIRSRAYTTLVRPVLEYASVVWGPHQHHLIQHLENAQHRAARFATGDYSSRDPGSVTTILHQLGWEPLEHRRARNRVIMFYKIYHHIMEVPTAEFVVLWQSKSAKSAPALLSTNTRSYQQLS
ncbi:uncharacterized protein LOC134268254 [Saccostrea cucullata]|uniref:uncharacterized protein LOC134268254 n=1 Tax=Saccostrea cuccullata TaxID=36930 RepID=UPI002ED59AE5